MSQFYRTTYNLKMASLVQAVGYDQEMMSQTETEDTDTGDASYASVTTCSQSTKSSSTSESNLDSTSSGDLEKCLNNKQSEPVVRSVDLTDVTELEDNASAVEDSASKHAKHENVEIGKEKVGFPDLDFTTDWYNHDCFKAYWEHYKQVMSWCGKHFEVYGDLMKQSAGRGRGAAAGQRFTSCRPSNRIQYPNSMYMFPGNHPYTNYHQNMYNNTSRNGCSPMKINNRGKKKPKRRKAKSSSSSEVTYTCSEETQTEASEEFQMEITQDMIDFFAKTQEHRRQREQAKKAERDEQSTEQEHVNVEDVKVTETRVPTVQAPKERPGARRTAEMKLLYGKGAAMVHGMETALQMTYDRNTDLKQPKIWPNMPLRVVFA